MAEFSESADSIIRPGIQRGLDFVRPEALRKRTGVPPNEAITFTLQELTFNALDKSSTEIKIEVNWKEESKEVEVVVSDNGSQKFTESEIELIADFDNEASSKRGLLRVSRGYLGNALKCVIGYVYVLGNSKTVFESLDSRFIVEVQPDWQKGRINHHTTVEKRQDDGFTSVRVVFPCESRDSDLINRSGKAISFKDFVLSTSYVNQDRRISYKIWEEKGVLEPIAIQSRIKHKQETSALWYTYSQFDALVRDFVAADPQMNTRGFLMMFRGMSSKAVQSEIIEELGKKRQKLPNIQDAQESSNLRFLPISEVDTECLFDILRQRSEPIDERFIPSALGCIGKDGFKRLARKHGWINMRYKQKALVQTRCDEIDHSYEEECNHPSHVTYPSLLEVVIFDRGKMVGDVLEPADGEGPKTYYCVNFAATTQDLFRDIYDVPEHLARAGLREQPVTVIAHYVAPILYWLNYGKTSLSED